MAKNRPHLFSRVIGVGGIGTGGVYQLEDNRTLGRNESRPAYLLPARDFCKQHIILHYVAQFLRDLHAPTKVLPIGAVGGDEAGQRLIGMMQAVGMDISRIRMLKAHPTLFSLCLLYPDKSGANVTESRSASGRVTVDQVTTARPEIIRHGKRCLVLAAPEVPMSARHQLLKLGKKSHGFTAASFVASEMNEVRSRGILSSVDLLAINLEEAASLAQVRSSSNPSKIVSICGELAAKLNPGIRMSVTHGAHGSYSWQDHSMTHLGSLKVRVQSTAGAGDAFFSGLLLGTLAGLPFHGKEPATCVRLARLLSAKSVTSQDTIDFNASLSSLGVFAKRHGESRTFNAIYGSN